MKHPYRILIVLTYSFLIAACSSLQKKGSNAKLEEFIPKLKKPEVRKVWVPDQIVGDEYVTGHWKFVLQKNSVWTKEK